MREKIYIDVEIDEKKLQKIIDYFQKIDEKAKQLQKDGVSKRNVNRIIKKCIKINDK